MGDTTSNGQLSYWSDGCWKTEESVGGSCKNGRSLPFASVLAIAAGLLPAPSGILCSTALNRIAVSIAFRLYGVRSHGFYVKPNSRRRRQRVTRLMPNVSAARVLFPPHWRSASSRTRRSSSSWGAGRSGDILGSSIACIAI